VILTTARLEIRPIQNGDAEAIWPFVSDPGISRYMSWNAHDNIAQTQAFIADVVDRMSEGSTVAWVLTERETGAMCGLISLIGILRTHRSLRYDKAELAYWVGAPFQGLGYATEACLAVMEYAFKKMNLNKLTVAHDANNAASGALIRRLGFREVGVEYRHFCKNGIWVDHVIYELLAPGG
jgi:RimJ/RimL family protein N-acetyltransferase